jgi:hypothetical protein
MNRRKITPCRGLFLLPVCLNFRRKVIIIRCGLKTSDHVQRQAAHCDGNALPARQPVSRLKKIATRYLDVKRGFAAFAGVLAAFRFGGTIWQWKSF